MNNELTARPHTIESTARTGNNYAICSGRSIVIYWGAVDKYYVLNIIDSFWELRYVVIVDVKLSTIIASYLKIFAL